MSTELIKQKEQNWAKQGVVLAKCELWFSKELQDLQNKCNSLNPTVDNIAQVESEIDVIKKKLRELEGTRKKVTQPLDDVKKRLSQFEKDGKLALDEVSGKLLTAKKEAKKKSDQLRLIEIQKADLASAVKSAYMNLFAHCESHIYRVASEVYADMLKSNTSYEKYDDGAAAGIKRINLPTIKEFFAKEHVNTDALDSDTILAIKKENVQEIPDYVLEYSNEMQRKKASYQAELQDVEEALRIAQEEEKERKKKIEQEKRAREAAAKMDELQAKSQSSDVEMGKSLKYSFELDMPETPESALRIWAAFQAYFDEAIDNLNIKKWFSATPKQIGAALAKMKSKDNSLTIEGVTFKKVEKL